MRTCARFALHRQIFAERHPLVAHDRINLGAAR
jgi:hypothetical protein